MQTYSVKELVPVLKRKEKSIRNYILEKELKASLIGNRYVITEEDLQEFIQKMRAFNY